MQAIDSSSISVVTGAVSLGTARKNGVGTGGMATKVEAALIASNAGVPVVVTSTARVTDALAGEPVGTLFAATGRRPNGRPAT